ncbi:MAG: hypothetical protein WDA71_12830 [Actinomycetota bacterium]
MTRKVRKKKYLLWLSRARGPARAAPPWRSTLHGVAGGPWTAGIGVAAHVHLLEVKVLERGLPS